MIELTITIRDMYATGTDTVVLQGKLVEAYEKAVDKSAFLTKLETVSFADPYVTHATKKYLTATKSD